MLTRPHSSKEERRAHSAEVAVFDSGCGHATGASSTGRAAGVKTSPVQGSTPWLPAFAATGGDHGRTDLTVGLSDHQGAVAQPGRALAAHSCCRKVEVRPLPAPLCTHAHEAELAQRPLALPSEGWRFESSRGLTAQLVGAASGRSKGWTKERGAVRPSAQPVPANTWGDRPVAGQQERDANREKAGPGRGLSNRSHAACNHVHLKTACLRDQAHRSRRSIPPRPIAAATAATWERKPQRLSLPPGELAQLVRAAGVKTRSVRGSNPRFPVLCSRPSAQRTRALDRPCAGERAAFAREAVGGSNPPSGAVTTRKSEGVAA